MIVNHQEITADAVVAQFTNAEMGLIVMSLELVATEQARVSFVPANKNLLPEWVLAQEIKNKISIAFKSRRVNSVY